jgi:hypothetical protein
MRSKYELASIDAAAGFVKPDVHLRTNERAGCGGLGMFADNFYNAYYGKRLRCICSGLISPDTSIGQNTPIEENYMKKVDQGLKQTSSWKL